MTTSSRHMRQTSNAGSDLSSRPKSAAEWEERETNCTRSTAGGAMLVRDRPVKSVGCPWLARPRSSAR